VSKEGRFFVVYPRFISRDGLIEVSMQPDDHAFLESLRAGAIAHFADTKAYAAEADSGFAEIVEGRAGMADEPLQREFLRYVFVRRGATWEFVRRIRLYST
jgi:hypothetical protein